MTTRIVIAAALLLAPAFAEAQTSPPVLVTEFPATAVSLDAEALKARLTGKVFKVQTTNSGNWRLDFKSNGYVFLDTSGGYRDTGRWRVEGSSFCDDWQKGTAAAGCNEIRVADGVLLVKRRSNGEIVAFKE